MQHVSVWQNDIACAQQLRDTGDKFIAADHYAVDCIRPKCTELQRITDEYRERLEHRRHTLDLSHRLHQLVDKVPLSTTVCHVSITLVTSV